MHRVNQATSSNCLQCGTCNQALSLFSPPHKKQPWGLEPVRPGLQQKNCQSCCLPFQLTRSSLAVHHFQTTNRVTKPRKQILNCMQPKLISRQPSSQGSNCSTSLPHSFSLKGLSPYGAMAQVPRIQLLLLFPSPQVRDSNPPYLPKYIQYDGFDFMDLHAPFQCF